MEQNTALDEVSRGIPDSATMSEADQAAARSATIAKVIERTLEAIERLDLIQKALGSVLPDLIAKHALGEATDVLMDLGSTGGIAERLTKAVSDFNARIAYAKEVSMPARLDDEECQTFNTERARVTRTARTYASIVNEQKEAAFLWLRENGLEALIQETVNASSLSGAAKERMAEGHELPEDLFKVHIKDSVSLTNKQKKAKPA